MSAFRCGSIAIVGRPNTGKSSLLNALLEHKLAIVSPKAQTTRHLVTGIRTTLDCQYIFVDSPGFQTEFKDPLHRMLNRRSDEAAQGADVVLQVVEAMRFVPADRAVLARMGARPVIVAVNKIDRVKGAGSLLPFLESLAREHEFSALVPVSAKSGKNLGELLRVLREVLPEQPAIYAPDQLTDRDERFFAAEAIREKLFRILGEDLPYRCEVVIESFKEEGALRRIEAVILVERESQKAIVIGRKGEQLKRIASAARRDLERLYGGKVYLGTWVKVRSGWSEDPRVLRQLGYG